MPSAPHDSFFKSVFAQPREARGEIIAILPAEITRALKMETLTLQSGSYADRFHQHHTDLLFSAHLRDSDKQAFVFLLVEHQSQPDRWMPFRLLRYMVRIWGRWLETAPSSATELPFIFPMVVHHGERLDRPHRDASALRPGEASRRCTLHSFVQLLGRRSGEGGHRRSRLSESRHPRRAQAVRTPGVRRGARGKDRLGAEPQSLRSGSSALHRRRGRVRASPRSRQRASREAVPSGTSGPGWRGVAAL